ncbi:MAG TPA: HEAT repeat domain-containing protein [Thermoanaerobaculia bacterium]|nr:HEAT repeat domain-containing protein [Thermoanaerobaculia bacterium]
MSECHLMKESMPLLLTESLDRDRRELTHRHIETCARCADEWQACRETWALMGELPEVDVPARVREGFLAAAGLSDAQAAPSRSLVPFRRRRTVQWLAQAAAVVIVAGGAYFAGHRAAPVRVAPTAATIASVQPVPYSIAETLVLPASQINPQIEGSPDIQNVQFLDADGGRIGLSFDVTSRVTVTGKPSDRSMVQLLSYVLQNENSLAPSRSQAIEWVRQTYSDPEFADPEIANALARVLRSDQHEGVRIRAAETLRTLPAPVAAETREVLIEALKNDPNPAVRIKAVEALANLARTGGDFDLTTIDTLRLKAAQVDENLYVRAKAAELLSSIQPQ